MPTNPPVTNGLSVWLCSDTNVETRPDDSVVSWGAADASGLTAASIGSTRPQLVAGGLNGFPVIRFNGEQGLFLETGVIAEDSFTLIAVGRATAERSNGGSGLAGQKLIFYQDGAAALTHASVSLGYNGVGIYQYGADEAARAEVSADAACLCPLVVRYENRTMKVFLCGNEVIDDGTSSAQPVDAPHGIGGTGGVSGGFEGDIAEVLIYNRALSEAERQQVEDYVQQKYACGPSSSSSSSGSSEESSSWSSEQSSMESSWESSWSSEQSSSSMESSAESSWSSEQSSEWSSEQSSEQSSSSCSCEMPSDPVPVSDGLVAWQRTDLNVSVDGSNRVTNWGAVCHCLPDAQSINTPGPQLVPYAFGNYPGIEFSGLQGLLLQAGNLGSNDFTLMVIACPDAQASIGTLLGRDASQSGAVAEVEAAINEVRLSEPGGSGGVRLAASTQGCLCPLTVIYEGKQARIYWLGALVADDSSTPAYDIWIPKLLGGSGTGGFAGRVAEVLFYNRALDDSERQQVEAYLMNRYDCLPGSSGTSSEQSSSSESSEESESSMSSSSSYSSSSSSEDNSSDSGSSEISQTPECQAIDSFIRIQDSPVQYVRHVDPPLQTFQVLGVTVPPLNPSPPVPVQETPTFRIEHAAASQYIGIVCRPSAHWWPLSVYVAKIAPSRTDPQDSSRQAPITENTITDVETHELAHVKVYKDIAININNFYSEKVRLLKSKPYPSQAQAITAITQMEDDFKNDCIRWFKEVKNHFNDHYHSLEDTNLNQTPSPIIVEGPPKEWRCRITDWYEHFQLFDKIDAISPASDCTDAGVLFQKVKIPEPK